MNRFRRLLVGVVCAAALSMPTSAETVVVINSYHSGFSWSDGLIDGIRSGLARSGRPFELFVEYLDTKRFSYDVDSERMATTASLLSAKYEGRRPDLIMTTDDNALDFYLHYRMFPDVPVVFAGVNHIEKHRVAGEQLITGVTEQSDHERAVEMILKIHPECRTIYVVTDQTTSGRGNREKFEALAAARRQRISFEFISSASGLTFEALLLKLRHLPDDSVVLYREFFVDSRGDFIEPERLIGLVSAASPVPVYSFGSMYLGHGITGGIITSSKEHGRVAADLAIEVLRGTPPSGIPIRPADVGRPMFDYKQLRRFGIPRADLPFGSEIIGRPSTFYRDYAAPFWLMAVTIVSLAALSIVLAVNVRKLRVLRAQSRQTENYLTATLGSMGEGLITIDSHGRISEMNQAAEHLTGFNVEEVTGRRASTILGYHDDRRIVDFDGLLEHILQLESPVRSENGEFIKPRDGSNRRLAYVGSAIRGADGGPLGIVLVLQDVTEARQVVEELEKSERRLVRSQAVAHVGSWELDPTTGQLWASAEFFRILGLDHSRSEVSVGLANALVARDDRRHLVHGMRRLLKHGETLEVDLRVIRASDHEVRFLNARAEPDENQHVVGTVQDITESKVTRAQLEDSLREKEVLLREVHHRVKNNMQVISSLINLQMGQAGRKSLDDVLMDSQNRIRSMALIHDLLYQSETFTEIDLEPYLRSLSVTLFDAYDLGPRGVEIEFETESVCVDIDRAIPCGLMANEILSNSLKYAFNGSRKGRIFVNLHRNSHVVHLDIGDDGVGLPADQEPGRGSSLGMQLIKTLSDQLGAGLSLDRTGGTVYRLTFEA